MEEVFISEAAAREELAGLLEWVEGHLDQYPLLEHRIQQTPGLAERVKRFAPHDGLAAAIAGCQLVSKDKLDKAEKWYRKAVGG